MDLSQNEEEIFFGKLTLKEVKIRLLKRNLFDDKQRQTIGCVHSQEDEMDTSLRLIETQSEPDYISIMDSLTEGSLQKPDNLEKRGICSTTPEDSFLALEEMVSEYTENKTEELNNTVEVVEYILEHAPYRKIKAKHLVADSFKRNDIDINTMIAENDGLLDEVKYESPVKLPQADTASQMVTNTPAPSQTPIAIAETKHFTTPYKDMNMKTPMFKIPANTLLPKKSSSSVSNKKTPNRNIHYQHIASPVASYIKNCPQVPLVQDVRPKKPLPAGPSSSVPKFVKSNSQINCHNKENIVNLPPLAYKSAKKTKMSLSLNGMQHKPSKSCRKSQDYMDRKLSPTNSAHTPPGSPEDLPDDDSLNKYGSAATAASVGADYAPFNGTTFSGTSMRYVLHCSSHAGLSGDEYLTPTQRAQKQIQRLKDLLHHVKKELEKKDSEIFHLTKEVVELRLYKASICSPDEKSNSSEIVTIRENAEETPGVVEDSPKHQDACISYDVTDSPLYKETPTRCHNGEMQGSFTDSGHFDDLTNSSLHSKESIPLHTHDASCMTDLGEHEEDREKKIEDLLRDHIGETQELKTAHNDKVEVLLQKLADVNTRYCELLPNYEQAKERIHILEKQLEEASRQLQDEESRHRSVYLQMYNKGVEAAKFELDKEGESSERPGSASRVSVEELLEQLQITQSELENV